MKKRVIILGASGSIGQTAISLMRDNPLFEVVGLSVRSNTDLLLRDATALGVKHIAVSDIAAAEKIAFDLPQGMTLYKGDDGLVELASIDADVLLCAVVGMAGLRPVLAAIESGKDIALATKEVMVSAGEAVMKRRREKGVSILPVDSEHSAIFQSLQSKCYSAASTYLGEGIPAEDVIRRLILTASGGPFMFRPEVDFDKVTVEEALNHPKWSMGRKITIDSATMMNKGLEIIEARWLFNVAPSAIDVLVHPESIVHSIVEYNDLTQIAELSIPDMTFAINYALTWPKRAPHNLHKPLDLATLGTLHFSSPDEKRFPCLALAKESLVRGGTAPAILNAANEIAVEAFLQKRIRFSDIWCIVEKTLDTIKPTSATDLDSIFDADLQARKLSAEICSR